MTTEIVTKNYERLDFYIDQCLSHLDNAQDLFIQCCKIAVDEIHMSPQEAWTYVHNKLKDHVAERTLYMWADKALPEGAKKSTKPKKIATLQSPEQENIEPESHSESTTGSQGEEIEQETVPEGVREATNDFEELREENQELRKALEETRKEVKILREINPEDTKNPDQTRQIKESLEKTLDENRELKEVIERQQWQTKKPIPFVLPKRQVPELIRDLNHSLNNDVQMFLCEDNQGRFLDWITGYQTSYNSEIKRELAQRREYLERNATQTRQEQGQESASL